MGRRIDPDRIALVEKALVSCEPHAVIVRRLSKAWHCKPQRVERVIYEVLQRWRADDAVTSVDDWRLRLTVMALDSYRECRRLQHTRGVKDMLEFIASITGVTESKAAPGTVNIYSSSGAYSSDRGQEITAKVRRLMRGDGGDDDN